MPIECKPNRTGIQLDTNAHGLIDADTGKLLWSIMMVYGDVNYEGDGQAFSHWLAGPGDCATKIKLSSPIDYSGVEGFRTRDAAMRWCEQQNQ